MVNVTKVHGSGANTVTALDNVTVGFGPGEFTAVMGPSGSGKSTLVHCLAGLDRVTSGEVWIGQTELASLSERQLTILRRTEIGIVFQAFNLLPTLTAAENIALPLAIAGREPDKPWYDRVLAAIGLDGRLRHRPAAMSGGEQQRVAGARALMSRPKLIIADEPTGNLDSQSSGEILRFMRRSVDEFGQSIVMVTHDPIAAAYADRVLMFADGRIMDELHRPGADTVIDYMKRLDYRPRHESLEPDGNGYYVSPSVDRVVFMAADRVVDEIHQPSTEKVSGYLRRLQYKGAHLAPDGGYGADTGFHRDRDDADGEVDVRNREWRYP
jgi:putative ABC transport system ATP-binding protein